jgi:hypothetical protein
MTLALSRDIQQHHFVDLKISECIRRYTPLHLAQVYCSPLQLANGCKISYNLIQVQSEITGCAGVFMLTQGQVSVLIFIFELATSRWTFRPHHSLNIFDLLLEQKLLMNSYQNFVYGFKCFSDIKAWKCWEMLWRTRSGNARSVASIHKNTI